MVSSVCVSACVVGAPFIEGTVQAGAGGDSSSNRNIAYHNLDRGHVCAYTCKDAEGCA